jgi:hypothetical protein
VDRVGHGDSDDNGDQAGAAAHGLFPGVGRGLNSTARNINITACGSSHGPSVIRLFPDTNDASPHTGLLLC